ncbi:kinesin-like protein KIN-7F isoform X2 [Mangifera indica]|uniref:kinesin-like protein KIN-7F isoform X2 n=1 Tax=Mangifera indica TaxID=29780 RepID=UPI001CFC364F|nr:kinesin-like protein KIN-7F isoform X2 [Mangifera indica]
MGGERLIPGETQDLSLPSGQQERIQVLVRLRPLNDKEIAKNDVSDWECINNNTIIFKNTLPERSMFPAAYSFVIFFFFRLVRYFVSVNISGLDRVFEKDCTTKEVYEEGAKEVCLSVVSGINSSIFAYGQTSSGKTYTMRGITEYAISDIYDYIEKHKEREFVLKFSAMEIYNESVRDLISDTTPLRLLDDPERGTVVEKLTEETLRDQSHLEELLAICEAQRQIGETSLNETSSRSHQILRLTIESSAREYIGADKSATLAATVNFVDLAGSERASQALSAGVRLKEGSHINRSLLTLGKVVRTLSKGRNTHIPYRDSKLTRILQNSLGGDARTAIICTLSPAHSQIEQSRNTLLFASCAKEVVTNAHVNVVMSDKALVKQLQRELTKLESEMKSQRTTSGKYDYTALLKEKEIIIEQMEKEIRELTQQRDLAELRIENLLHSRFDEYSASSSPDATNSLHAGLETPNKTPKFQNSENPEEDFLKNEGTRKFVGLDPRQSWEESAEKTDEKLEDTGKEVDDIERDLEQSSPQKKDKESSPSSKDPIYDALKQKIEELQRTIHYLINLNPQEQSPSSDADVYTCRSAKINRSTSCRPMLMSTPSSLAFEKAGHSENTPPNWLEENFAGRTGHFYPRLSVPKHGAKFGNVSRKDSQTSISEASMESQSFKELDADYTTIDGSEKSFHGGPVDIHQRLSELKYNAEIQDLSRKHSQTEDSRNEMSKVQSLRNYGGLNAMMNNIEDSVMKKEEDAALQVPTWPAEFDNRRKEIIELWNACNVPLVHRTYFYLLFKGDPSDSVYMEVELRRLTFLKGGNISKENLNASLKAIYREREALSKQIHKKFSKKEREELYQKWDIDLNTKQRSLQLARQIWACTKDMNHIDDSAALVAKLVGFVQPGQAPKEVFGLSLLAGSLSQKSFSWRFIKSTSLVL